MIEIYTDGSSTKNRAGWGFVVVKDNKIIYTESKEYSHGTNQQMELLAALSACQYIDRENLAVGEEIVVYSDSAYLINCYEQGWYSNWLTNGWLNSKGESVANQTTWHYLIPYFLDVHFTFVKVKGHCGVAYNELADKLACGKDLDKALFNLTTKKNNDTIIIKKLIKKAKEVGLDQNTIYNMIKEVYND